ncbi:hypothetical protein AEGHOMDF_5536 [Methylobacterium soli]|nr:hypothetical protein AEGHOMDF_5536 [Methylobacterium soli]
MGDQQQARVEALRAVILHEAVEFRIEALLADLPVDLVPDLDPTLDRCGRSIAGLREAADRPVEGDPGHHLRVHEVLAPAAHLPDALVRLAPRLSEKVHEDETHLPSRGVAPETTAARLIERVEHLAVDVELELLRGRVADAHGPRALVARQPVELDLGQQALARDAVEDVGLLGVAGHRPQEPVSPGARLLDEARIHQRQQREGRVAQPAEPVVPVAHAPELLGQRGRRRGHDPAGGHVDERLQRQERALQDVVPGRATGAVARPVAPERIRGGQHLAGLDRCGILLVGGAVTQGEGHGLASPHREFRDRGLVRAPHGRLSSEHHLVGPGDGAQVAPLVAGNPGDGRAVVEAQRQIHPHGDPPVHTLDEADQVRAVADRHVVGDQDFALPGRVAGLEDEGAVAVASAGLDVLRHGRETPEAVLWRAEQRGEAGGGVEVRKAQPVDAALPADQRGRVAIADERVILDPGRHRDLRCSGPTSAGERLTRKPDHSR